MNKAIIAAVQKAGFDVYMRRTTDSWLYFTDGKNIGYLQDGCRGAALSTAHIPNTSSGAGYGLRDFMPLSDLTKEILSEAFMHAPNWSREPNSVRKWKDMQAFIAADSFNRGYALVVDMKEGE